MATNIKVQIEFDRNAQKHFISFSKNGNNLYFHVSIPSPLIGVDEELAVSDEWQAILVKRTSKANQPFLFKICSPSKNKKGASENHVITLECRITSQNRCKVRLTKFKSRIVDSFHINAYEVVIPNFLSLKGELMIFTKADIRIQAIVQCPKITLESKNGNITVTSEGTVRTASILLNSNSNTSKIDGIICGLLESFWENKNKNCPIQSHSTDADTILSSEDNNIKNIPLKVDVVGNLHIGTDGRIGCGRNKLSNSLVTFLQTTVKGNIYNFGIITASIQIDLEAENVLSGRYCKDDTVQRYYDTIRELYGLLNDIEDFQIDPTTSNLIMAVKNQNPEIVASLLQIGMDPLSPAFKNGKTAKDLASRELWKIFKPNTEKDTHDTHFGHKRDRPDIVHSLIRAWDKRSGSIISRKIQCRLEGDIEDCSQLLGLEEVNFDVSGDIIVEEDSIWTSGTVTGKCGGSLTFHGKTKLRRFENMTVGNTCHIKDTGMVLLVEGGTLLVKKLFKNNSVFFVCSKDTASQLHVTTDVLEQTENATMGTNSRLQVTVLADTTNWEGNINGKSLCFDVRAKVQADCNIESFNLCLIKIMEGRSGLGQFILRQRGLMKVKEGEFVAVKENVESRKFADILVAGKISSRGIRAPNVNIDLLDDSFVEISPDAHCFIKELKTRRASKVHFNVNEECNTIVCKFVYWSHFGEMIVKKMSPVSCLMKIEAWNMLQNGKIENCNKINLTIHEDLINTKEIIVEEELKIKGPGNISNAYESVIKCQHGSVKMEQVGRINLCPSSKLEGKEIIVCTSLSKQTAHTKWDFKNKGKITSEEKIDITAWNIFNKSGEICSRNSGINMSWMTQDKTCLDGIVTSPGQIAIFSENGKHFQFKCTGGSTQCQRNNDFKVPKDGLIICCPNGDVLIDSKIDGEASKLEVYSKKGILFSKNANLSGLHFQTETTKPTMTDTESNDTTSSWISITDYGLEANTINGRDDIIGIREANSSVRLIRNSVIKVNETILQSNDSESNTFLKTYDSSKFISTNTILADGTTYVDGSFEFLGHCTIQANVIKFVKKSQCMMSQDVPQNRAVLSIRGNDLSFAGKLIPNNCLSEIEISAENIDVSGLIKAEGPLYLHNAKDIRIQGAQMFCHGLFCLQNKTQSSYTDCYTSLTLLSGFVSAKGSVRCDVKDFTMNNMSTIKVQTKTDNCIINATASANVSGTFECTGHGIFQLHCGENLIMEKVMLNVIMPTCSLRARNTFRTDNKSVLRFGGQYGQLLLYEISRNKYTTKIEIAAEKINISGRMESGGPLYLNDATEIKIEAAQISCLGLSCKQSVGKDNYAIVSLLSGLVNVIGPVECYVKEFSMDTLSSLKVQTKEHCVINATSSANVSGTFECTGHGIFQLHCGENLIMEEVILNITMPTSSLRARNTFRTDNKSVLQFGGQIGQLPLSEISTKMEYTAEIELAAEKINISGQMETRGPLYLNDATEIKIEAARISCLGLSCTNKDHATVTLLSGLVNVIGPLECYVKEFTMDGMSSLKMQTDDDNIINATLSIDVSGKFECSGQGNILLECGENLILEESDFEISLTKCTLKAVKSIKTNRNSVLQFNGRKIELSTGSENDENVDGEISLCGSIYSSTCDSDAKACFEIECRVLQLTGSKVAGFKSVELYAASIITDLNSGINNVGTVKIEAASIDAQGQISTVETMEIKVDDILVRGLVQEVCDLKIDAEHTAVNCGTLHANRTGISAPVFLNCPEMNGENSLLTNLPTLGKSKELIVEGLLCIIVGSFVQGTKITISSVMRFDFSSKTSTKLPNADDLSNWKKVVDSSLCSLSNSDQSDIHNIVKEALQIPQVVCQLGVGSHLCKDIVKITEGIQKQGLGAVQLQDIVSCLNKAHTEYTKISTLQICIQVIPKKLKKIKNAAKTAGKKIMETIFGRNSFTSTLEFKKNDDGKESIESQSFCFFGENTDVTTGQFVSKSLVLGGDKGIWKNEGVFESCGDIIISAKFIEHGDKQKRLMRSLHGCIQMQADKVIAKGLEGKSLHVKSAEGVKLESVDVKENAVVECDSGKATIKDIKADNLHIDGNANVDLKRASVNDNIDITGNKVEAKDVSCKDMSATAEKNVDIGDFKIENNLSVESKSGNINVNSKIKAGKAELVAEKGKISLKNKHGEANHELQQLIMKTKRIDDVQEMLSKTGVYQDLKIAEEMDLAVSEQSVILANMDKIDFTLKLNARDIDVQGNVESSKSVHLTASDGSLKVRENVRVSGKEDVSLKAKYNVSLEEDAYVEGDYVFVESENSSVSCTASTIKAGNSVAMKAKEDINIQSTNGNEPAKKSNIIAGKGSPDSPSVNIESGRDVNIYASGIKSEGENKIKAARDINITGHTYQTRSTVKKKKYLGLMTETTTTTTTHVDKAEISGHKNSFFAGGNFTSSAGKLRSESGQTIHAKGKVTMKDIVGKTIEDKSTDVLGGFLYHRNDHSESEQSHGTFVEDTSSMANTTIISDTSDIEWTGSSIKSSGGVHEEAKMGRVVHKSRILTNKKSTTELGFFTSSSSGETDKTVGYGFHYSDQSNQSVSGDSMDVGKYSVKANEFSALNAFDVKVDGDMTLDVKEFHFQGAELLSSKNSFDLKIELDKTTLQASANYSHGNGCTVQHQALNVGGKLKIQNAQKGAFDCSQADIGEIEGAVENLDIISRTDKENGFNIGCTVGVDVVTRKPEGGLSGGISHSEVVSSQTTLNVRGSSKQFEVGTLKMKGAVITFDDDVHNFAKEIITEDVKETESNFDIQFSISRPKKLTKGSKTLSLSVNHKDGKIKSCIASRHGKVDDKMKQRVNTDIDKCREVNREFSFSIKHTFKGKLSKNLAEIGKKIAKSAGEEIAVACLEEVSQELGLPMDILKSIIDIAQGQNPLENAFDYALKQIGKCVIPDHLLEALQDLLTNGNPLKIIVWIGSKTNIHSDIIEAILEVLQSGTITNTVVIKVIKTAACYIEFPKEIVSIVIDLLKCTNQKGNIKDSLAKFLKSKDGQKSIENVAKWTCGKANIPPELVENTLEIVFRGQVTNAAIVNIIQTAACYFKFPNEIVTVVVQLLQCCCKQGNVKDSTMSVLKSKAGQESIKDLAKLLDVPVEITDLILDIMSQPDTVAVGQVMLQFVASKTNIPSHIVPAVISVMKDPNIKTIATVIFGTVCKDKNLIQTLGSSIVDCKDTESVLREMFRVTAQHFGISRNIIDKIQKILQGKCQPDIQTGIDFLKNLSDIMKRGEARNPKLEQVLSIIQNCFKNYEKFSAIFANCLRHGFSISACLPIFELILELVGVEKEVCESLKSILVDKNLTALKRWLPVIREVDTDTLFLVAKDIINGSNIKDICITLLTVQAKKLKLTDDVTADLVHIINGNKTQRYFRAAEEIVSSGKDDQLRGFLRDKLSLLPHQITPVIQVLNCCLGNKTKHVELFVFLSTNIGVPGGLTTGIKEWVHGGHPDDLADWIEEKTGLEKPVTIEFMRLCSGGYTSETIIEFMFSVLKSLGLLKIVESLRPIVLSHRCLELKEKPALIYTIIIEVVSPHIKEIAKYTRIPSETIEKLLSFSAPKEQCLAVLGLICEKVGISKDVFDKFTAFIVDKDVDPLADLIARKTEMDSSLVKAILYEVRNTKSVKSLIKEIPMCLLKHVGLSGESIFLVQQLLSGKMPKGAKSRLLKAVIEDIMKSEFGQKIIQKIFGQADNQGMTDVFVSSVQSILTSDTPLEAVCLSIELLSEPIGIPKDLCKGISKLVLRNDSSTLIPYLAKSTGYHTIPWIQTLIETILNYDNTSDALQQTSSLLMTEIGFSSKSVDCVLKVYEGNCQPLFILTSLLFVMADIVKICQPSGVEESSFLLDNSYLLAVERSLADSHDNPDTLVLHLISLFLNITGIDRSVLRELESFISSGNCESFITQICNHHNVDHELTSVIISMFSSEISNKQKLQKVAIFSIQRCRFPKSVAENIIDIIQGNTVNKTALLQELGHSSCCGDIASDVVQILEEISDFADIQTEDLLKLISVIQVPILPSTFVNALVTYVYQGELEPLAKWISEYVQIDTDIINAFLEAVFHKTGKQRIIEIIAAFAKLTGMEDNMVKDLGLFLEGQVSLPRGQSLLTKLVRFILSQIANIAAEKGLLPKQILAPTNQIINGGDFKENVTLVVSYFLQQLGLPKDLIEGCFAFIQHRKTQALGEWVAKATGADRALIFKLLEPFEDNENILSGIRRIPNQIVRYLGMSDRMVKLVEDLVNGRRPEGDLKSIIQDATLEVLRSRVTTMAVEHLSDRFPVIKHLPGIIDLISDITKAENVVQMVVVCVRYFATKFEIPAEIVEGGIDLLQNRDPTKLVSLLAHKVGIDQRPLMVLLKVLTNQEIISFASDLLKGGGQIGNVKDTTVKLLKSKEGQVTITEFANVFGVPTQITDLILNVINQSDASTIGQSVFKFIAYTIGLPGSIVDDIISAVKNPTIISFAVVFLEQICDDRSLIQSLRKCSLNECTDIESAIGQILKITAQHFGMSSKVTEYMEQILHGECQLDFQIGLEIVKDLVNMVKRREFKNTKLDEVLSVMQNTCKRLEQFSSVCRKLTQTGFSISAFVPIVQLILEMIGVPKELCDGIKSVLIDKDLTPFQQWLPKIKELEPKILILLANDIMNGRGLKDICLTLLSAQTEKMKLSDDVTTELKRTLQGNEPLQCLKAAYKMFLSCAEDMSEELLCEKLGLSPNHMDSKAIQVRLFTFLATHLGVPQEITKGIEEWMDGRNSEYLAGWIDEKTGLQKSITIKFMRLCSIDTVNETMILEFMFSVLNCLGLSRIAESLRPIVLAKRCLERDEIATLIYKIIHEILSPHVMEISKYTGLPIEILEELLNFSSPKDQCLAVLRLVCHKAGIPKELLNVITTFIIDKDVEPMADVIVRKTKMNSVLVKAILYEIRNTKSIKGLITELPMCLLNHIGLSRETIGFVQQLLTGKMPKCTKVGLLKAIIADIMKSSVGKQLSDNFPIVEHLPSVVDLISDITKAESLIGLVVVCIRFLAPKLEIPAEIMEGLVVLLLSRDPEKLVSWLASKIGVDKKLLMAITKAIVNKEKPFNILKSVAKLFGLPEEAVILLEEIIKNKKGPVKPQGQKKQPRKKGGSNVARNMIKVVA